VRRDVGWMYCNVVEYYEVVFRTFHSFCRGMDHMCYCREINFEFDPVQFEKMDGEDKLSYLHSWFCFQDEKFSYFFVFSTVVRLHSWMQLVHSEDYYEDTM